MTTNDSIIDELLAQGVLKEFQGDGPVNTRCYIVMPTAEKNLERLKREKKEQGALQTPGQEIYTNLIALVEKRGQGVKEFKIIDQYPEEESIWSVKGNSTRVFGFFYKKGVFIVVNAELKVNLINKPHEIGRYKDNKYARFKNQVRWARREFFQDKSVTSEDYHDLL